MNAWTRVLVAFMDSERTTTTNTIIIIINEND